jgi:hypothetical protein
MELYGSKQNPGNDGFAMMDGVILAITLARSMADG